MTYQELKITSYLFTKFSNYDENYIDISARNFDLTVQEDIDTMLTFLRNWGCRQFKIADQELSSNSLRRWYRKHLSNLPRPSKILVDASDRKIRTYASLFDDLMNSPASIKNGRERDIDTTIGPVGAAKTLFGLRKNFFPPWDNPIINKLNVAKSGAGYCDYLVLIKNKLLTLREYCDNHSIDFYNLPAILDRPHTSLPKLADEYLWVSTTRRCLPSEIIRLTRNGR